MTDNVLNLVRQYASERYMQGVDDGAGRSDAGHKAAAEVLFARIAELLPQHPAQARDEDDMRMWIHACGFSLATVNAAPGPGCGYCRKPGPWRPLLVAADSPPPAADPEPGRCPTCNSPQPSMHPAVGGGGEVTGLCPDAFHATSDAPPAAGPALEAKTPVFPRHLGMAGGTARCGETHPTHTTRVGASVQCPKCLGAMQAEIDELTPEDIRGYREAIGAKPVKPDTLVLRLPEVPEGTVALTGVAEPHRRWEQTLDGGALSDRYVQADGSSPFAILRLGALLDEEPEGVRVELAPPSAPEPRTAAEVWASMSPEQRDAVGGKLAEALDRESGAEGGR